MKRAPLWLMLLGGLLGSSGFVVLGAWALTSGLEAPAISRVDEEAPSVRSWVAGSLSESGGELVVQTVAPAAFTLELPLVEVDGLTLTRIGEARREVVGSRVVVTERYQFTGAKGMYEVGPLSAYWNDENDDPKRADSEIHWIDMGVDPPRDGEIVDIAEPSPVWAVPVWPFAVVGGVFVLMVGGLVVAFRAVPSTVGRERALPPHVLALREWARVRQDASLDDYATAVELSRIFRDYAEAVLGFPASAYTTKQTVEHLAALKHLPEGNVPRAKRLLRATDLVKYAEKRADGDFFDDLDSDLRAFVDATRPAGGPNG